NTDIARLSKDGGGIGVYMGKVRARGSSIKGYKGASSGVIPWIRQLNNTAVSVDQLGRRKGAIAVYLDVWHADILAFLDLKLNNGDEKIGRASCRERLQTGAAADRVEKAGTEMTVA